MLPPLGLGSGLGLGMLPPPCNGQVRHSVPRCKRLIGERKGGCEVGLQIAGSRNASIKYQMGGGGWKKDGQLWKRRRKGNKQPLPPDNCASLPTVLLRFPLLTAPGVSDCELGKVRPEQLPCPESRTPPTVHIQAILSLGRGHLNGFVFQFSQTKNNSSVS